MLRGVLLIQCLLLLVHSVISEPPEDPVTCTASNNTNCTITNSYGVFPDRTKCRAASVTYPTTEEELLLAVKEATVSRKKMKVVTRFSHSIPKLVCPDGQKGLLISTKLLNRTLGINATSMTIQVQSGVTLRQLINDAAQAGLALPYAPYWWGLTVGGLLGTGAHGSSLWGKGSSVHDYVVGLTIVSPGGPEDGFVRVRRLDSRHKDFDAAKVSLGVLGVISQVTLQLQPIFKRSITYETRDDSDLGDQAVSFGKQHEFADLAWFPNQGQVLYRIDDRVPSNVSGNGLYDFIGFRSTPSIFLQFRRKLEETQEFLGDVGGKCLRSKVVGVALKLAAYGLTNDGDKFRGYPVIGYQNRVQSSGTCLDDSDDDDKVDEACPWDPRAEGEFFHQTTFSVGLSKVKSFIQDVQKLVKLEPKALCGVELYNGILMRYVKASSAYLGKQEDGIDFDFTYYRSKDPMTPRLYEDVLEEIEQMAVFKFGALPHWGKNRNLAFEGAIGKYAKAGEFLKVREVYDPLGLFSSKWTDQVLGLKGGVTIVKDGCALEGLCKCSLDVHCAPEKKYFCRPGKVYKDARVCRKEDDSEKTFLSST